MPASKTRTCTACQKTYPTPLFRDEGDAQRGRPPRACRFCRAVSPALQAQQAKNVAYRPENIAKHRDWAARPLREVFRSTRATYPDGRKTCPPYSGCGRHLPTTSFGVDSYQTDGLTSVCLSCSAERGHNA